MNPERLIRRIKRLQESGYEVNAKGRVVHRELYKAAHGRIPKDWVVHHIDCNKKNNTLSNLIALPARLHSKIHDIMRKNRVILDRAYIEKAIQLYRVPPNRTRPGRKKWRAAPLPKVVPEKAPSVEEKAPSPPIVIRRSISSLYR